MDKSKLTDDTLLTVKEASLLTGKSIPAFYTDKRQKDLGFHEKGDGVWLIRVGDLVNKVKWLTPDYEPRSTKNKGGTVQNLLGEGNLENTAPSVEELRLQIGRLENEVQQLRLEREEFAKKEFNLEQQARRLKGELETLKELITGLREQNATMSAVLISIGNKGQGVE